MPNLLYKKIMLAIVIAFTPAAFAVDSTQNTPLDSTSASVVIPRHRLGSISYSQIQNYTMVAPWSRFPGGVSYYTKSMVQDNKKYPQITQRCTIEHNLETLQSFLKEKYNSELSKSSLFGTDVSYVRNDAMYEYFLKYKNESVVTSLTIFTRA